MNVKMLIAINGNEFRAGKDQHGLRRWKGFHEGDGRRQGTDNWEKGEYLQPSQSDQAFKEPSLIQKLCDNCNVVGFKTCATTG